MTFIHKEKEHRSWVKLTGNVIHILASLATALTLFFAVFPQFQPFNRNYVQMANAGDVESQMFLAEHYYEVGENEESHYWYKIASMYPGNHQGAALNNVACIGLTYKYYNDSLLDYQSKALNMFKKAAALGDKAAVQNMYALLKEMSEDTTAVDYQKELAWVIQVSHQFGVDVDGLSDAEVEWAFEQFQLNEHTAYVTEEGWISYDTIGIYPEDNAFEEKDTSYNSYIYHPQ